MKTYRATEKEFNKKTYLIDATDKTLGRLASPVAALLMGKGKPNFAYDQHCGDSVVIINAEKIHVTGTKKENKVYTHYTGYPSGLKEYNFETLMEKKPEEILKRAISRMLPKNRLGREMLRRLRVYTGANHQQQAQKPEPIEI